MSQNDAPLPLGRTAQPSQQRREQPSVAAAPAEPPTTSAGAAPQPATSPVPDGAATFIDVSQLPPPQPMVRILETLRVLGPGATLVVHHTRRPIHLYPKLDGLGCVHETRELPDGMIEVRITNPQTRLP